MPVTYVSACQKAYYTCPLSTNGLAVTTKKPKIIHTLYIHHFVVVRSIKVNLNTFLRSNIIPYLESR